MSTRQPNPPTTAVERMRVQHADAAARRKASVLDERDRVRARERLTGHRARFVRALATETGLPEDEIRELLRAGRSPADIQALSCNARYPHG